MIHLARALYRDSVSYPNKKVSYSNFNYVFAQPLGPNLLTWILVTSGSSKIRQSDQYLVSETVSLLMLQSWPLDILLTDEKSKKNNKTGKNLFLTKHHKTSFQLNFKLGSNKNIFFPVHQHTQLNFFPPMKHTNKSAVHFFLPLLICYYRYTMDFKIYFN